MTHNQLMLLAASRGARIQNRVAGVPDQRWWGTQLVDVKYMKGLEYRIHPDDEHYRFGPISSLLYKHAQNPPVNIDRCFDNLFSADIFVSSRHEVWYEYKTETPTLHRSIYLLLMAEVLAGEGL